MGNNHHGDLGVGLSPTKDLGIGLTPTELKYSHEPPRTALEEMVNGNYLNMLSDFQVRSFIVGLHHVIATLQLFLQGGDEQIVIGWDASRHKQLDGFSPLSPCLKLNKQACLGPSTLHPHTLSVFQNVPAAHTDPIMTCALGSHHSVFLHHSGWITGLGSNKE